MNKWEKSRILWYLNINMGIGRYSVSLHYLPDNIRLAYSNLNRIAGNVDLQQ